MSAPDRLLEAWTILGAAVGDERIIRVEPTGVSVGAGEILAGLDIHGGRHLLVPSSVEGIREDRRSAGVQIRGATLEDEGHQLRFLDVVCLVPRLNDLFAEVASDMLEALILGPAHPAAVCYAVLERWRELLEKQDPRLLGPQQLTGLFGELLILKDIVTHDPSGGIDTWTGPDKKQHDFTGNAAAIEVKTTTVREGRIVEVHGVEQLEAPADGALFLAFVRLDVDPNGTPVPALVDEILALGAERRPFLGLLSRAGYDPTKTLEYASPAFIPRERRLYAVTTGFPRVVGSSFVDRRLPPGVLRLRYDIDLTGEPPRPLDDRSTREVIRGMTAPHD